MGTDRLKEKINKYISTPLDPYINSELAVEYESIGQTASALSYYLRAAELTYEKNPTFAYSCLIKTFQQVQKQTRREEWEKEQLHTTLAFLPKRPEAYYFLSLWYEKNGNYKKSYSYACMGLEVADHNLPPLPHDVGYPGKFVFKFQKAVSSWWIGQRHYSETLWTELYKDPDVDEFHFQFVINNLINFKLLKNSHGLLEYKKDGIDKLKYKFKGIENIEKNYSQCYQDLFVLTVLNGKTNGTYLEVGAGDPFYGNNTMLLEELGWKGVSLDLDKKFLNKWKMKRYQTNKCIKQDATTADYLQIVKDNELSNTIDYLQLDCDPAKNTYKALKQIPFDKLQFRVITYEHDYYLDATRSYREKSREFLLSQGYLLVAGNISPDKKSPYEDWWVHPELVDINIVNSLINDGKGILHAKDYILNSPFDFGPVSDNTEFLKVLSKEIIEDKVYEKFNPIKEGDIVVDLGANVGLFSYSILDKKPKHIYCVEPEPECYNTLVKNVGNNPNVTCINKAIAEKTEEKVIKGLFNKDSIVCYSNKETSCPTLSLKDLVKQNNIKKIDFLKCDCEGGEYEIFTKENYDWITKNVKYIAGEFHLADIFDKRNFIKFRELYLPKNSKNWKILTMDLEDITYKVWDDDFVKDDDWDFLSFNLYINNTYL
jgi:FkbM family methyltransferase